MRARFVTTAIGIGFLIVGAGCSLFVSLDDLADGDAGKPIANDGSSDQGASGGDSGNDGMTTNDSGNDAAPYASVILADSPLAYFHFDETGGTTLADSSGHKHDATSTTVLLGQPGAFSGSGTAAHFDGDAFAFISDSVSDAGTEFDFVGHAPFSLEAWVKLDFEPDNSEGQEFTFFSKEKDVGGDNFIGFDFLDRPLVILQREDDPTDDTQAQTSAAGIPDTTNWHYLLATYDGSTIEIFIDNVLVATKTGSTTTIPVANVPVLIGAEDTTVGNGLIGLMDEAAIYTTALTLTQRTAHFNAAGH